MNPARKHILVTGGSEGIGRSMGEIWLKQGASVTLVARTQSKLDAAKAALEELASSLHLPGKVACFSADITSLEQVKRALGQAEACLGPVDVLICNAGYSKPGYFMEQPAAVFEETMRVNYLGTVNTIKVAAPGMVARSKGHIAIIGSGLSLVGFSGFSSYAPTKWALRGLADCLRNEFVDTGVEVSISYPPDTDTPGYKTENLTKPPECAEISAGEALLSAEKVAKHIVNGIRQGAYHIPAPDFGQELLAAKMAGLSPAPGSAVLNFLLAPILVLVAMYYRWSWDKVVRRAVKAGRKPWQSTL
eukprot:jgi/Tetstr1/424435/TSEL_001456.t1